MSAVLGGIPGLPSQVRGNTSVDDAEHLAHDGWAAGEQIPQGIRNAQHPLAYGLLGEDFVDQQRGALGHAPGIATGAEAPPLAATITSW